MAYLEIKLCLSLLSSTIYLYQKIAKYELCYALTGSLFGEQIQ